MPKNRQKIVGKRVKSAGVCKQIRRKKLIFGTLARTETLPTKRQISFGYRTVFIAFIRASLALVYRFTVVGFTFFSFHRQNE